MRIVTAVLCGLGLQAGFCLLAFAATSQDAREPRIDPNVVNQATSMDTLADRAKGAGVLRAQILLDRAHFSCGEIDANYGRNMVQTVKGYQRSHQLPETGEINANLWKMLYADREPALLSYTISADDVKGPFTTIPHDMLEKAKLPAMGFESASEALGEKFHVSPELLSQLNPGKDLGKAGTDILVPNVIVQPPPKAASVIVNGTDLTVDALDDKGAVLAHYPATVGSEHDPLPVGDWKVASVLHNPTYHYNPDLFWDAKSTDAKATVKPGPNSPVGIVWIALTKEHYGIHGTPEPHNIGHTQSHGCIRLTNWDAEELSQMVGAGTNVVLKD